jgi:hypothetical protein
MAACQGCYCSCQLIFQRLYSDGLDCNDLQQAADERNGLLFTLPNCGSNVFQLAASVVPYLYFDDRALAFSHR